jgi:gamma-glutamylputrescine oxidase
MPTIQTYYEATVSSTARAALAGTHEADVCIVGGGLAGLCTALGLVERGVRDVMVLEQQRVGHGASGRNGGFVFGGYSLECADLLRVLGAERARELYRLTTDAVESIRQRIARYEIQCDVVHEGVILANWFDEPARLDTQRRLMKTSFGVDWEPIAPIELRARVKSDRYHGGLLERNAFHFHPLKYVLGIANAVTAGGGNLYEQTAALEVKRDGAGFTIRTTHGRVRARHVVMAGGGYARRFYRPVERAVLPIATYVIATEPLGTRLRDAIDCGCAIYDTRFAFDYYHTLPDTRILWGGRVSVLNRGAGSIARLLERDLLTVYPQLKGARIDYAWGGLMSYARHKMPQIGRTPDGIWYAVGFGGHGMAPTTVSGELLSAAIAEQTPIPAAFSMFGLNPTFGWLGLAAAQTTYSVMQARDVMASRRRGRS